MIITLDKLIILTVSCYLYILTDEIVEERYNLYEKVYSETNSLNVEKITMINEYLVVFFSEVVEKTEFQEKN